MGNQFLLLAHFTIETFFRKFIRLFLYILKKIEMCDRDGIMNTYSASIRNNVTYSYFYFDHNNILCTLT